jgi:hypothetical protein
MGRVSHYKKNALPQPGRSGGYIEKAVLDKNVWQVFEKVSIPTKEDFLNKVKHITDNTIENSGEDNNCQFRVFDKSGKILVAVIGCTNEQLRKLL